MRGIVFGPNLTVIRLVAFNPCAHTAVIVVLPGARALTRPLVAFTIATDELLETKVVLGAIGPPN